MAKIGDSTMETEVKTSWFIVLIEPDNTVLYYNEDDRNWTLFRRDATSFIFENSAVDRLESNIKRNNVPSNSKVIKVTTTITKEVVI